MSISGVEVVAPYGNENAAYHLRLDGDYLTFCGRKCEDWTKLETTLVEALGSAFACKRCVKAAHK